MHTHQFVDTIFFNFPSNQTAVSNVLVILVLQNDVRGSYRENRFFEIKTW